MRELSEVGSARGAPMGRVSTIANPELPIEFEIHRLRWVDGDYDQGGAYWGGAEGRNHIYRACPINPDLEDEVFVRATSLDDAKRQIGGMYVSPSFGGDTELDAFYEACLRAALWSTANDRYEEDKDNEHEMLDDTGRELAPRAEAMLRDACRRFQAANAVDLAKAYEKPGYSVESAGHDFALSGSGSGSGFQDRDLEDGLGERLCAATKDFSCFDLYTGNDDLIYITGDHVFESSAAPAP